MTHQPLISHLSPKVEADAQVMTLNHLNDVDDIQEEDTICHGKNHCLPKWSFNYVSFMVPPRIVGELLLWLLIEEGMMIENYGKRYGIFIGMNCRGCGGGYLDSKSWNISYRSRWIHHLDESQGHADLAQYTPNGVPIPKAAKDDPNSHSFMHAVHHPDRLRPAHDWVDWFTDFKGSDRGKLVGLEFQEGLWAEKFAIIAILITIAIIVVSIVWVIKGGQLQTVFTVMGFVLSGAAGECYATAGLFIILTSGIAELALVALYFQVTTSSWIRGIISWTWNFQ